MSVKELAPLEDFNASLRRLPILVVLMIAGGLLGWVVSLLRPPVYEARALIIANIDPEQTGPLLELEQDQLIFAVQGLLIAPDVLNVVNQQLAAEGVGIEPLAPDQNISLERRRAELWLKVTGDDPVDAARAANIWAETAYAFLVDAHAHALRAESLREYLAALETCPEPPAGAPALCGNFTPEEVRQNIDRVNAEISTEIQESRGVISALNFDFSAQAQPPEQPAARNRFFMIVGGALSGFAAGAWFALRQPQEAE